MNKHMRISIRVNITTYPPGKFGFGLLFGCNQITSDGLFYTVKVAFNLLLQIRIIFDDTWVAQTCQIGVSQYFLRNSLVKRYTS